LIDTTRDEMLVAFIDGDDIQTRTNAEQRRHSETLNKIAAEFIPHADIFAVVTGPGSWTGSRVGVVAVKSWAFATGKPIIALQNPYDMRNISREFTTIHELAPYYDSEFKVTVKK